MTKSFKVRLEVIKHQKVNGTPRLEKINDNFDTRMEVYQASI